MDKDARLGQTPAQSSTTVCGLTRSSTRGNRWMSHGSRTRGGGDNKPATSASYAAKITTEAEATSEADLAHHTCTPHLQCPWDGVYISQIRPIRWQQSHLLTIS